MRWQSSPNPWYGHERMEHVMRRYCYNVEYNTGKKHGLFGSAGKKIRGFGIFLFVLGTIASIGVGIYFLTVLINVLGGGNLKALFAGGLPKKEVLFPMVMVLVCPLGGTFASWIISLLFYGFGDLIDKNT